MRGIAWLLASAWLALPDDGAPTTSGLLLRLERDLVADVRVARLLALHVPAGAPPSARLAPGPFVATWDGFLEIEARDRFTFAFEGDGSFELDLDEQPVLRVADARPESRTSKPVRLNKGKNRLKARYASATGAATVRVLWSSSEFPREPLSPLHLSHAGDAGDAARAARGRELFATRRCVKCHARGSDPARAMPELAPEFTLDAPLLNDAGARLERSWVAAWVRDPHALRADARMPALGLDAAQANDVAAFLATLGQPGDAGGACSAAEVSGGARLFTTLGCVACHGAAAPAAADGSLVSLALVARKWQPLALEQFLRAPARGYRWIRMPDFHLTAVEARMLAGHVLAASVAAAPPAAAPGDAVRGRDLAARAGCASCHTIDVANRASSPRLDLLHDWSRGCLSDDVAGRGTAPDFALDGEDREALRAFCRGGFESLERHDAAEFAERAMHELRCLNCHSRDQHHTEWHGGEPTGNGPPNLTWAGEKLQASFVENILAGTLDFKPRPWLAARMPSFAAPAAAIARGLSCMHGCSPEPVAASAPDAALAAIGKRLVSNKGGFSCTSCHAVGAQPALQVFEAEGINLMYSAERLRRDFFLRWIMNPMRIEPASRMPTYADDKGKTAFVEVLAGDAQRQFEAIWEFLQGGRAITR